jgi:hypothetical protein
VASTVTGPDGSFVFENLPGGTYTLTASGYAPVATVVQVGSGGVTTADVEFPAPAGSAPSAQSAPSAPSAPSVNGVSAGEGVSR